MISSFQEAVADLARKRVLPSALDSAGLRQLSAAVRRQSVFSARTTLEDYLEEVKRVVGVVLDPQPTVPGGPVQGFDPATARMVLREKLAALNYVPAAETEGSLTDLSSDRRIDLVVRTNTQLSQGAGDFIRQNDELLIDEWPAQELYRLEPRDDERDWSARWMIAAQVVGDAKAAGAMGNHGRMAALKSSGIWQALGDGEGGYQDTLGNPYPPFAFNSGMWTRELDRDEAEELGLIEAGDRARTARLDLQGLFGAEGES